MKKALSLILALALCLALAVPALAVESALANLTPEAAMAYRDVIDDLYCENGKTSAVSSYTGTTQPYVGMCGGYIVDLGDGGTPELIVAFSKPGNPLLQDCQSFIRVYTWNGTYAAIAYEQQVLSSGNGRTWASYTLKQNRASAWLDVTWKTLPSYNYSTGQVIDGSTETTHYRMANGAMTKFASNAEAASAVELGSYDYIFINNYSELSAMLPEPEDSVPESAGPAVTVGGKVVAWPDAVPFVDRHRRTMVPLRAVADALNLTVSWVDVEREAVFTDGSKTICFPIGSKTARTGDGGSIEMDTAAVVVGGRTYAPVRYLAEYFGYTVGWDAATRTVIIS